MAPPNARNGVSENMAGHRNGDAAGNMTPPAGRAGRDGNFTFPRGKLYGYAYRCPAAL